MDRAQVTKRWCFLAFAAGLAAAAVALVLWGPAGPTRADEPPGGAYGGIDDYYIARGWTEPLVSQPLPTETPARPAAAASYACNLQLPAISGGPEPMRETRALWVTRWDFLTPTDIQRIVDKAAYAHFNTLFFQVRGQADAVYRSDLEPWWATDKRSLGQDPGFDPLAEVISRAHAAGLEVHAWINVYPAWRTTTPPPDSVQPLPMYHDFNARYGNSWLQWSTSGPMQLNASYLCASPAYPAVVDHIVAVCRDILTRYPVDGLHFDYIRYDDRIYSYDPYSEQTYAAARAADPLLTRAEWQRRQVTGFIERVRREALPARPGARLTAAVWPVYVDRWDWFHGYDGYSARYQDSQPWARNGLLSAIAPMLYGPSFTNYRDRFEILAHDFVAGSQPGAAILGITGEYDSFDEIAWRIETARTAGAQGQAILSYGALAREEWAGHNYWQAFRDGPYSQIAVPNWGE